MPNLPLGHVEIAGKNYIITDESYKSRGIALFRPQLQVVGISKEALDQYLYMAQDTWDKGSHIQALTGRWLNGGFGAIQNIDNSVEGQISLQSATSVVYSTPTRVDVAGNEIADPTRILSVSGWLIAANEAGWVKYSNDGVTWNTVAYDFSTFGAITALELGTTEGGGVGTGGGSLLPGSPGGAGGDVRPRLLVGTKKGYVGFLTINATLATPTVTFVNTWRPVTDQIVRGVMTYRDQVVAIYQNRISMRRFQSSGSIDGSDTFTATLPGAAICMATWNQVVMIGVQASTRGSVIVACDAKGVVDTYRVDGAFQIQSMTTWGGQLIYGGRAPRRSEVYTFPGILADRIPAGDAPASVMGLYALHKYVLCAWNGRAGLWWIDDKGTGAYCQFDTTSIKSHLYQRVRSVAMFDGEIYYTVDNVGIIRVKRDEYQASGYIESNWFDAGFPDLVKNFSDVSIRLRAPKKTAQTVELLAKVDGQAPVSIGTVADGRIYSTFPIPAALQQGRRINLRVQLGIPSSTRETDNFNRPNNNSLGTPWTEVESAASNLRVGDLGSYRAISLTSDGLTVNRSVDGTFPFTSTVTLPFAIEGSATGGLWADEFNIAELLALKSDHTVQQSHDYGTSWTQLGVSHGITAPTNIFRSALGTLFVTYPSTSGQPCRILRSTDGGQTWTTITIGVGDTREFVDQHQFRRLADNTLLIALWSSLAANGGKVYRSTDDGATWTSVYSDTTNPAQVWLFSEATGNQCFLVKDDFAGVIIFRSTDGGQTWTNVQQIGGRINVDTRSPIARCPNGNLVIVSATAGTQFNYRSTNEGVTWTLETWTSFPANKSGSIIGVIGTTGNVLFVDHAGGNVNHWSTDNAATWGSSGGSVRVWFVDSAGAGANQLRMDRAASQSAFAYRNTVPTGGDQFSELTFRSLTTGGSNGVAVRLQGTLLTAVTGYAAVYEPLSQRVALFRLNGVSIIAYPTASEVASKSITTLLDGDVLRIEVENNLVTVKINGTKIIQYSDGSALTGGQPGVIEFSANASSQSGVWDDWYGGALIVLSPVVTAVTMRYRPIPIQNRVTGFTVKAAKNLTLADGSSEQRTPEAIISDLFALPAVGQVDFRTRLEPTLKKVFVTDVQMVGQLLGQADGVEEGFVSVEILDASAATDNASIANPPQEDLESLPLDDPNFGRTGDQPTPPAPPSVPGGDRDVRPQDPVLT